MRLAAAFLTLLAVVPAAAQAPEPWTSARAAAMAPEELTRRLLGDAGQRFVPDEATNAVQLSAGRLTFLSFMSEARPGLASGLCEFDYLMLTFEPLRPNDFAPDPPVRPHRIQSGVRRFILDLPKALRGGTRTLPEYRAFAAACTARDPRRVTQIVAFDEDDVVIALRQLTALAEAARAGRALAPLDCAEFVAPGQAAPGPAQCLAQAAEVDPADLVMADQPRETPEGVARSIQLGDWSLTFTFARGETVPSDDFARSGRSAIPLRVSLARFHPPVPLTE